MVDLEFVSGSKFCHVLYVSYNFGLLKLVSKHPNKFISTFLLESLEQFLNKLLSSSIRQTLMKSLLIDEHQYHIHSHDETPIIFRWFIFFKHFSLFLDVHGCSQYSSSLTSFYLS